MDNEKNQDNMFVKLPVYMKKHTRVKLDELKKEIEMMSGFSVSLSQLMRDAIIDFLNEHKEDAIRRYAMSYKGRN